jgi:hypothetical protein
MSVLGWRSVSDLRLWLKQHSAVAPNGLPCALVIAATYSKLDVSSSVHASREDALALFDALPPLTDVALGMQWQTVHLARLGSLASFLAREKLPIIEVSHGSFVKLEVGAIPHFEDALKDALRNSGFFGTIVPCKTQQLRLSPSPGRRAGHGSLRRR